MSKPKIPYYYAGGRVNIAAEPGTELGRKVHDKAARRLTRAQVFAAYNTKGRAHGINAQLREMRHEMAQTRSLCSNSHEFARVWREHLADRRRQRRRPF